MSPTTPFVVDRRRCDLAVASGSCTERTGHRVQSVSLPAIPVAVYMFCRYGRVVPRSTAGVIYFVSMLIGTVTVVPIAHEPASYGIAAITLLLLLVGYGTARFAGQSGAKMYVETISLTLTAFLLMLPAVSETLPRVPDGHPLATDLHSPILLGAQDTLFVLLIVGLTAQIVHLRGQGASGPKRHERSSGVLARNARSFDAIKP